MSFQHAKEVRKIFLNSLESRQIVSERVACLRISKPSPVSLVNGWAYLSDLL